MSRVLTKLQAKFPGRCAASGVNFTIGTTILHDAATKRCYLPGSEPGGSTIVEVPAGSQSAAYKAGWSAGAPGTAVTVCPYDTGSPGEKMWTEGLRDRHASGT